MTRCPCGKKAKKYCKECPTCLRRKYALRHYSKEDKALMRACWEERQRLLKEASEFTLKKLAEKFGGTPQAIHYVVTYQGLP